MKVLLLYISNNINFEYNNVTLRKSNSDIEVLSGTNIIATFKKLKLEFIHSQYADKNSYKITSAKFD